MRPGFTLPAVVGHLAVQRDCAHRGGRWHAILPRPFAKRAAGWLFERSQCNQFGTSQHLLRQTFGYSAFRDGQGEVVVHVASGGDALVLMPTGGGKSLCYQIPSLVRPGTGIVISPLIALMQDQVAALRQLGIRATFLNSTLSADAARDTERALLTGAPRSSVCRARTADHPALSGSPSTAQTSRCSPSTKRTASRNGATISGPNTCSFRCSMSGILGSSYRTHGHGRSANVRTEIIARLGLDHARVFVSSFDRPNIRYTIVDKSDGRTQLLGFIRDEHPGEAGIVYCLSRRKVDETAAWLATKGVRALPYHAGMDTMRRADHQAVSTRRRLAMVEKRIALEYGHRQTRCALCGAPRFAKKHRGVTSRETGRAGRDGAPADAWMAYGLADVVQRNGE